MTNAIEQAKREMYAALSGQRKNSRMQVIQEVFEEQLEKYLELLRKDHEALHETARKRFEDLQAAEAANQELASEAKRLEALTSNQQQEYARDGQTIDDLESRLAKMTEERDSIQLRLHAVDHAYKTQQDKVGTSGQVSGDRAYCELADANAGIIRGALVDAQRVMVEYLVPDGIRAKDAIGKMIPILDNEKLYFAMRESEKPSCMHFFFKTVGDQMKCTFCGVGK